MKSNNTSPKATKMTDSATQSKAAVPDSKPVKRTTKSSAAAKASVPSTTSHKHSKPGVAPVSKPAIASKDEVAFLAHAFWVERGYAHGYAEEDWFRAERALSQTA